MVMRQFPDKLHVRTELESGHTYVGICNIGVTTYAPDSEASVSLMMMPSFEAGSVLMGYDCPPMNKYDTIDWDAYEDLNSVGFDVGAIVIPDIIHAISVFAVNALIPGHDSFSPPSVFVDVFWNRRRVGRTSVKYRTRWAEWKESRIKLVQPAAMELKACSMVVNLCAWGADGFVGLLGTAEFDGPKLVELLSPQHTALITEVPLLSFAPSAAAAASMSSRAVESVAAPSPAAEDEIYDPTGQLAIEAQAKGKKHFDFESLLQKDGTFSPSPQTLKLAILHCEFEMRIHFCQGLNNIENPNSINPFVIVVFNGRDIGTTDVKSGEPNPAWPVPTVYSLKVGTLDIFECALSVEVWQMGETGRENLLGQCSFAGKAFVDLVTSHPTYFSRIVKDLTQPIKPKDKEEKKKEEKAAAGGKGAAGKKGAGAKLMQTFGRICFDIGPVGLPPEQDLVFEISIINGLHLPANTMFVDVVWNWLSVGSTEPVAMLPAPPETKEAKPPPEGELAAAAEVRWPWVWGLNTFYITASSVESLREGVLKLFLCEPAQAVAEDNHSDSKSAGGKEAAPAAGAVSKYGCAVLTGDDLVNFLRQESGFANVATFDMRKDPDELRPQKPPRGTIRVRGGLLGARLEAERTLTVYACKLSLEDLGVLLPLEPPAARTASFFLKGYFNDVYIGQSSEVEVALGVDPIFENTWFHLPVNDTPLKDCTFVLEVLMLAATASAQNADNNSYASGDNKSVRSGKNIRSANASVDSSGDYLPFVLAKLTLAGNALKAVVGSKLTTTSVHPLVPTEKPDKKRAKKVDKLGVKSSAEAVKTHQLTSGEIKIGSPGTAVARPADIWDAEAAVVREAYNAYVAETDVKEESNPVGGEAAEGNPDAAVSDDPKDISQQDPAGKPVSAETEGDPQAATEGDNDNNEPAGPTVDVTETPVAESKNSESAPDNVLQRTQEDVPTAGDS